MRGTEKNMFSMATPNCIWWDDDDIRKFLFPAFSIKNYIIFLTGGTIMIKSGFGFWFFYYWIQDIFHFAKHIFFCTSHILLVISSKCNLVILSSIIRLSTSSRKRDHRGLCWLRPETYSVTWGTHIKQGNKYEKTK
jgi:hypothetical protein